MIIKKKKVPGLIRAQMDLDELELPHNVKLEIPNKEKLDEFKILIRPDSGLWKGALYTFSFIIPDNYPYSPPKVTIVEKIYHPNIDLQGNICLNLLKDDWRPILTIQQVIHGLLFLFLEQNIADPLNQDAAEVYRNDYEEFKKNVQKSLNGEYVGGAQFVKQHIKK